MSTGHADVRQQGRLRIGWQQSDQCIAGLLRDPARRQIVFLVKQLNTLQALRTEALERPRCQHLHGLARDAAVPGRRRGPVANPRYLAARLPSLQHDVAKDAVSLLPALAVQDGEAQPATVCPAALLHLQPAERVLLRHDRIPPRLAHRRIAKDIEQ
ncbi:MAG: hypothetical protein WBH47_20420, partial [Streptosporangiaceae bacterium]